MKSSADHFNWGDHGERPVQPGSLEGLERHRACSLLFYLPIRARAAPGRLQRHNRFITIVLLLREKRVPAPLALPPLPFAARLARKDRGQDLHLAPDDRADKNAKGPTDVSIIFNLMVYGSQRKTIVLARFSL